MPLVDGSVIGIAHTRHQVTVHEMVFGWVCDDTSSSIDISFEFGNNP